MLIPALGRPWRTLIAVVNMRDSPVFFCFVIWPGKGGVFPRGQSTGQKLERTARACWRWSGGRVRGCCRRRLGASKTRGTVPHVSNVCRSKTEGRAS
jgi:hypothetical protein